ncbi:molybdopterin molybdotransferase MoeA [Devriesea agamarum]|uniref:molybdopterin molybdotransferase MoeA n=1 Tax=Devriesea agamarum TaxID=472569 RepID=UPI00071DB3F3|nr:molybdopterin molybdotransferase MoeA [Devriesea agamarum]
MNTTARHPDDELSFDQWRQVVSSLPPLPRRVLEVPLGDALGRRLAEPFIAPSPLPDVPCSAMDGFALRSADLLRLRRLDGTRGDDVLISVANDIPAGPGEPAPLAPGMAARIMTGAPLPAGADLVVPVEQTDSNPGDPLPATVRISGDAVTVPHHHVRAVGEEIARGSRLAGPATLVGPGFMGVAAALGMERLKVLAPQRIAVVATGDELVRAEPHPADSSHRDDEGSLRYGEVRESNTRMLSAALAQLGHDVTRHVSGDHPRALLDLLDALADEVDLMITTGGIGAGSYDVVKAALGPDGRNSSRFAHLHMRPGAPQGCGVIGSTPVVHCPGTPVGALLGMHLFGRIVLREPPVITAMPLVPAGSGGLDGVDTRSGGDGADGLRLRRHGLMCVAANLESTGVALTPGRRLAPYARANAVVLAGWGLTEGRTQILPGDLVNVALLGI